MRKVALYLIVPVVIGAAAHLAIADTQPSFQIPSSLMLNLANSSSDTKSATMDLHLMLPRNFWIAGSLDSAKERVDDFETTTNGGGLAIGTDPLADYTVEIGMDGFGVNDQYRVREGRIRAVLAPWSVFEFENPGIEIGLEYRIGRFAFSNSPNVIFNTNEVELETRTAHIDLTLNITPHWALRLYGERTSLPSAFADLNRPLAPLFIPESAISTAVSWPDEEGGASVSFNQDRFGVRFGLSQKHAAISGAISALHSFSFDYRWTRAFSSGFRISSSRSLDDTSLDPIQTAGVDFTVNF